MDDLKDPSRKHVCVRGHRKVSYDTNEWYTELQGCVPSRSSGRDREEFADYYSSELISYRGCQRNGTGTGTHIRVFNE